MRKLLFISTLVLCFCTKAQETDSYDYGILRATEYSGVFNQKIEWHNGEKTEETTFNKSDLKELSFQNRVIKKIENLEETGWSLFSVNLGMTANGNSRTDYMLRKKK